MTTPHLSVSQRHKLAIGIADLMEKCGIGRPTITVTEERGVFLERLLKGGRRIMVKVEDTIGVDVEECD